MKLTDPVQSILHNQNINPKEYTTTSMDLYTVDLELGALISKLEPS